MEGGAESKETMSWKDKESILADLEKAYLVILAFLVPPLFQTAVDQTRINLINEMTRKG
jgi:hypothetical protein